MPRLGQFDHNKERLFQKLVRLATPQVFAGNRYLCRSMGCGARQLQRYLKALMQEGKIRIKLRRMRPKGQYVTHRFVEIVGRTFETAGQVVQEVVQATVRWGKPRYGMEEIEQEIDEMQSLFDQLVADEAKQVEQMKQKIRDAGKEWEFENARNRLRARLVTT